MMVSILPYIMMFIMLTGGSRGGTDVLDLASTDSYWQLKHVTVTVEQLKDDAGPDKVVANVEGIIKDLQSADFATRDKAKRSLESMGPPVVPQLRPAMESKDPEVAAIAADLVKRFSEHGQERAIRRLMAIRTLGEQKEKEALPLLKTLVDSKELFVADYAKRAIAQISGQPSEPVDHQKEFAHDVALLPANLSVLFQAHVAQGDDQFFDKLIDESIDFMKQQGDMPPEAMKKFDKPQIQMAITQRILSMVELVGDVQMEGMTAAVSDNIGQDGGWAIISMRGKYNSRLVYETLNQLVHTEFTDERPPLPGGAPAVTRPVPPTPTMQPGEIPRIAMGSSATFLFPSDESLIMITGGNAKEIAATADATVDSLKAGKGTMADNADFAARMKTVDTKALGWGILRPNDEIKKMSYLEPFDVVTLEVVRQKDRTTSFTFKGEGADADKVKAAGDSLSADIQNATAQIKQAAAQEKFLGPAVDFMQSLKVAADAKKATFTGEIKPSIIQSLVGSMGGPEMIVSLLEMADSANGGAPMVGTTTVEEVPVAPTTGP